MEVLVRVRVRVRVCGWGWVEVGSDHEFIVEAWAGGVFAGGRGACSVDGGGGVAVLRRRGRVGVGVGVARRVGGERAVVRRWRFGQQCLGQLRRCERVVRSTVCVVRMTRVAV